MSIQVKLLLGIFAVIFLANFLTPVQAGFRTWACPPDENVLNTTCQITCQMNHNALYGWCGKRDGDYNCYCSPPLPVSTGPNMKGFECADNNDSRYDVDCRVACQCFFNAQAGYCDYHQRTCNCVGQSQDPTTNKFCPFKNLDSFVQYRNQFNFPGRAVPVRGPYAQNNGNNYQ